MSSTLKIMYKVEKLHDGNCTINLLPELVVLGKMYSSVCQKKHLSIFEPPQIMHLRTK